MVSRDHPEFSSFLRRASAVYPQPIAIALGRIARARSSVERLDGCLKAAEVTTRYLAAVCVASFAGRDSAGSDELSLSLPSGNLAFGHFLEICQRVAKLEVQHPCKPHLAPLRPKGKGAQRVDGAADSAFVALLKLRNELGHDLAGLSRPRAESILVERAPLEHLVTALESLEALLSQPLLIVDQQRVEKGRVWAVTLWLMGDSLDPEPEDLGVEALGFEENHVPYLAIGDYVLPLDPFLVWSIVTARERYGLMVVDGIDESALRYQTLDPVELKRNGESVARLRALLEGEARPALPIALPDGRKLSAAWQERKSRIEDAVRQIEGALPWTDFDAETIVWFAKRLDPNDSRKATVVIGEKLFDGRRTFSADEVRQATLLFGTDLVVRRLLQRSMLDLRVAGVGEGRWKERLEAHSNVLSSLRLAVEFVARNIGIDGATIDKLADASGTADYLAMREALVNLFVHQDYTDASAAGQVELARDRAMFFNVGHSLVSSDRLVEGGKSQSRNPLIARALRLIGFAELAGSGIKTVLRAWRVARRRPPKFESDREHNSFSVHLDWRPIIDVYDAALQARLGVRLTVEQAQAFNLACDPEGVTAVAVASATGVTVEKASELLRALVMQMLLIEHDGTYRLVDHLREAGG